MTQEEVESLKEELKEAEGSILALQEQLHNKEHALKDHHIFLKLQQLEEENLQLASLKEDKGKIEMLEGEILELTVLVQTLKKENQHLLDELVALKEKLKQQEIANRFFRDKMEDARLENEDLKEQIVFLQQGSYPSEI